MRPLARKAVLVMGILATLFGLGTGLFSSISVGARGAVGMVRSLLRATREQAVSSQAPARIEIDAVSSRATGVHFLDIGQWHFESALGKTWPADPQGSPPPTAGPFWGFDSGAGIVAQSSGVRAEPNGGAPGGYVALENGGRLVYPLAGRRAFQTDDGFGIALSARLPQGISGRLALRPRSFELSLTRRGALSGRVEASITSLANVAVVAFFTISASAPGALPSPRSIFVSGPALAAGLSRVR